MLEEKCVRFSVICVAVTHWLSWPDDQKPRLVRSCGPTSPHASDVSVSNDEQARAAPFPWYNSTQTLHRELMETLCGTFLKSCSTASSRDYSCKSSTLASISVDRDLRSTRPVKSWKSLRRTNMHGVLHINASYSNRKLCLCRDRIRLKVRIMPKELNNRRPSCGTYVSV
jgi:hypothetical protein